MRLAISLIAALSSVSADAKIARSREAIAEFKRLQPCPATGNRAGPCPGYDIDHRIALKCGGPDTPANMQWLTKDEHQAKTRREARLCRPRRP